MFKVLVAHNAYQKRGGEDVVVEQEVELLRTAGHEVHLAEVDNFGIEGIKAKAAVFWNTPFDQKRYEWMRNLIELHRPDVLHVHNFFPLLTPAIHQAAAEAGVAVVQTLHNFRTVCAGALLMRDGKICEKCLSGSRYWGVVHRCYRGSAAGSLAVVRMQNRADSTRSWDRHVHRFIALSEFAKSKLSDGGLPLDRLVVKPNFIRPPEEHSAIQGPAQAIFLGRLSPEKGISTLLDAWRSLPDIPLTIAGHGPEESALRSQAADNVRFVGQISQPDVRALLHQASVLVIPSLWYEGFPMVLLEALSHGVPVVASDIGSLGELVRPGINGALFPPGNAAALAKTIREVLANPQTHNHLSKGARATYEEHYTPSRNLHILEDIYAQAIDIARTKVEKPFMPH